MQNLNKFLDISQNLKPFSWTEKLNNTPAPKVVNFWCGLLFLPGVPKDVVSDFPRNLCSMFDLKAEEDNNKDGVWYF
jgi:hypothetical protein